MKWIGADHEKIRERLDVMDQEGLMGENQIRWIEMGLSNGIP